MKTSTTLFFLLFVPATPALAEVMDKEATPGLIWGISILCAIAGFLSMRHRSKMAIIPIVVSVVFFLGHLAEINDPFVGPDIANETGETYIYQSYGALALVVTAHLIGLIFQKHRKTT